MLTRQKAALVEVLECERDVPFVPLSLRAGLFCVEVIVARNARHDLAVASHSQSL